MFGYCYEIQGFLQVLSASRLGVEERGGEGDRRLIVHASRSPDAPGSGQIFQSLWLDLSFWSRYLKNTSTESRLTVLLGHSVVSDSLWPHGLLHTRPPWPSPSPGACSNPCPLSRWCHPTIWSSVFPFSSCLQSFPGSGSFLMSRFFTSGGQSIGASASTSVLLMNI